MTNYQFETFETKGTVEPFEVDGEIVQTYGDRPYSSRFVALVKKEDDDTESTNDSDSSQGVVTCSGKDGECSREVDEPGDTCWQHP